MDVDQNEKVTQMMVFFSKLKLDEFGLKFDSFVTTNCKNLSNM